MKELSPLLYFNRLIRFWWIVVLCTLAGGAAGFIYSRIKPPVYEARAIFNISIDLKKVPVKQQPIELHDEDIALASLWGTMLSPEVLDYLIEAARKQNITLDWNIISKNYTVERKNSIWELRYRNNDPQVAQTVVSLWATEAYEVALQLQVDQKIPDYVIFTPPLIPEPPDQPVYYGLYRLLLAGGLIGLLIGLLGVEQVARRSS